MLVSNIFATRQHAAEARKPIRPTSPALNSHLVCAEAPLWRSRVRRGLSGC